MDAMDCYRVLGVSRDASDDDIRRAYRRQALLNHPDRHAASSEARRRTGGGERRERTGRCRRDVRPRENMAQGTEVPSEVPEPAAALDHGRWHSSRATFGPRRVHRDDEKTPITWFIILCKVSPRKVARIHHDIKHHLATSASARSTVNSRKAQVYGWSPPALA